MATSLVLLISLHGPPSINEIYHKDDSFLSLAILDLYPITLCIYETSLFIPYSWLNLLLNRNMRVLTTCFSRKSCLLSELL